jgi:hypothetical protein
MYARDWHDFVEECSWFNYDNELISLDGPYRSLDKVFRASDQFRERFPQLTSLLSNARVTLVSKGDRQYQLYGWTTHEDRSAGWLCPLPSTAAAMPAFLHPDHQLVLRSFGGIVESWNIPDESWLLNLNSALCKETTQVGIGGWEDYYLQECASEGVQPLINPADYVSFAFEANGNMTAYHRQSAALVLFAHDHAFDYVIPVEGAPELTFYRIRDCPTLHAWIETVAQRQLADIVLGNHEL